jgi:hypothetical protein
LISLVSDFHGVGQHQYLYKHINRVCVIGIAHDHTALQNRQVIRVEFRNLLVPRDELASKPVDLGKRRREITFKTGAPVCDLICSDGARFVVHTPVPGVLLETRDNCADLNARPESDGYLALVLAYRSMHE